LDPTYADEAQAAGTEAAAAPPRAGLVARIKRRIPRGVVMLSFIAVVNVVLGFFREGVIAYYFGTSAELDTFLVAYTLPRMIVMQSAQITVSIILPLYVAHLEAGRRDAASALLRRWFLFLVKVMTGFCLAVALAAPILTSLIAPGLNAAQHAEAAGWLRLLLPYVWVITLAGCFKVVLDQNRRFFMPAMSGAFVSISVVIGCALGASTFGVSAMVPGYTVGGVVAFLFQWKQSRAYEPKLMSFKDMPVHVQLPLMSGGIMVLNSFAHQANLIVDRAFASSLPEGSIAALNYANSILMVPQSIVTAALATALFPVLSEMIARGDWRGAFRTTLRWTFVALGIAMIPVGALCIWRTDLVSMVFQRGKFGGEATSMTATVLMVLSFTLLVQSANALVMRLLLAQQQLRLILTTTLMAIVFKVGTNLIMVPLYGLRGVASATVVATGMATMVRYFGGAWSSRQMQGQPGI
jgi:putative peptidoglycan lipid II flippase